MKAIIWPFPGLKCAKPNWMSRVAGMKIVGGSFLEKERLRTAFVRWIRSGSFIVLQECMNHSMNQEPPDIIAQIRLAMT